MSAESTAIDTTTHQPDSVEELSDLLGFLSGRRQSARIVGGGTRQAFGNLGRHADCVISLANLNRVVQYDPGDLVIAVEPGCTLAQLHGVLASEGQMMALDAAHPERATIGGSYATGLSSPRRLGGGSLKDWVIGLDVLGPDGVRSRAGGMVVKNVTGYDMMHVHYAALGALGVVSRLNLKVFPHPGAATVIDLRYASLNAALTAAAAIIASQLLPASAIVSNDDGWRLLIRFDTPPSAVERIVSRAIAAATAAAAPTDARTSSVDAADPSVAPFVDLVDLARPRTVARIPLPLTWVQARAAQLEALAANAADMVLDVGSGLTYVAGDDVTLLRQVPALSSTITWLRAPASGAIDDVFGPMPTAAQPVATRLKETFDPLGVLNPGRWVLGL